MEINTQRWEGVIKKPDWYLSIISELEIILQQSLKLSESEKKRLKYKIYSFFEEHLNNDDIALGNEIGIWDVGRKPIDTIIIHHTELPSGLTKESLSAIELLRLYARYYAKPYDERDATVSGKAISSGHVRNGKQVFYPYHWIVRMDGTTERLLEDSEIGWHAGNWEVNRRSIAIVVDNDYNEARPEGVVLQSIAGLIHSYYKDVLKERIYGHCEVRFLGPTTCPSKLFLSKDAYRGWKEDLLALV